VRIGDRDVGSVRLERPGGAEALDEMVTTGENAGRSVQLRGRRFRAQRVGTERFVAQVARPHEPISIGFLSYSRADDEPFVAAVRTN
jgi:hypothetical protein